MSDPKPVHILVAEDNPADVFLIREALAENGVHYTLESVDNGEKAVERISRFGNDPDAELPQLIVLDLNLPRLDGTEILRVVRQNAALREVPVVILTSSDSPQDRVSTARLGATMYLRKPSNLDDFLKIGADLKRIIVSGHTLGAPASGN